MIRLTAVIEMEGAGTRALTHESNARSLILGRDSSADFQIPIPTISRQHSKISESDGVYVIEDLGSTHGTVVNGKKIGAGEKKVLRDGDVIEMTKAKITCNIEADKVVVAQPGEGTQAIAARAVQGILGRLGEAQREAPFLRVLNGVDEGQRFLLGGTHSDWTLGRSKDCEFVLNDPNVSRRHAQIKRDWNGFVVNDLGSKNGVLVNEKAIKGQRRLKDRDEMTIGPVKLVFVDPDADLLAALKDVPGFQMDDPVEAEPLDSSPSQLGAPNELAVDGSVGEGMLGAPASAPVPQQPELSYADSIDPELLMDDSPKFPVEWMLVAIGGLALIGAVVAVVFIFG